MEHDTSVWYRTTTEKILAWRDLREHVKRGNFDQAIKVIEDWWTFTPWVRKTMDPYKPDTWPTPWDMINKGQFCRSAIALGEAYTIWTCFPNIDTELWLINNFSEKDIHLIVVIQKNTVLNYTPSQILTLDDCSFELIKTFTKHDLNHIKIY